MRRHNLSSLTRLLHTSGPASRADLTLRTGLNRSTVKALTADLVAAGIARETAPVGRGSAGRPSIVVEPCAQTVYVLALDVGVEHLTAMRIGLGGTVLERRELRQTPSDYGVRRTVNRLSRLACDLQAAAAPEAVCVGVGVGVAGLVSGTDGVVRFAPNMGWVDVPLRAMLAERMQTALHIAIANDGDLGVMAEQLRGVARGHSDVVFIAGEVGIGGGVLLGGRAVRGFGGYGGEIGHMSTDPRGLLCRCGRRGCWETQISDEAVLVATNAPPGSTLASVLAAYTAGERWPQAGVRRVGRALGLGVANLVNIFNPELVVFGGQVRHVYAVTEPLVREAVEGALTAPGEQVRLQAAGLGDDSVVVGAGELGFVRLLDDPLGSLAETPLLLGA